MTRARARPVRGRGVAMVELALVLPIVLMLVLGAVDFGWFFVVQDAVSNAAREGARSAVVGDDGVKRAKDLLASMLPPRTSGACTVLLTPNPPTAVRVDATCPVGSLSGVTRIPPFVWLLPEQATAGVEMRL